MQSHLHFPLSIPFAAPGQAEQEMALLKKDLERRRDPWYRGRHFRWFPMLNGGCGRTPMP